MVWLDIVSDQTVSSPCRSFLLLSFFLFFFFNLIMFFTAVLLSSFVSGCDSPSLWTLANSHYSSLRSSALGTWLHWNPSAVQPVLPFPDFCLQTPAGLAQGCVLRDECEGSSTVCCAGVFPVFPFFLSVFLRRFTLQRWVRRTGWWRAWYSLTAICLHHGEISRVM